MTSPLLLISAALLGTLITHVAHLYARHRSHGDSSASPVADELAGIARELHLMPNSRVQTLADRLDALTAKVKSLHDDDAAAENADLDTLEQHIANAEATLTPPDGSGEGQAQA